MLLLPFRIKVGGTFDRLRGGLYGTRGTET